MKIRGYALEILIPNKNQCARFGYKTDYLPAGFGHLKRSIFTCAKRPEIYETC